VTTLSTPITARGKVLKKEEMEFSANAREYLTIKILHNDMTVRSPPENAAWRVCGA